MKRLFYFLFFLSFNFGFSQSKIIAVTKLDFITLKTDKFIGFDGFNNCFYSDENVLFKKSDSLSLQYQNLSLGKITKVDILNPLKIIVFYEEFNSVIILDNQLNEIQKIDFSNLETPIIVSAIGISGQNKLWVFNSLNQQIGLYDLITNQFKNLGIPIKEGFNYYQTDFNYFQWIDKQQKWNTCTIFGRVFQNASLDFNYNNIQLLNENKILFSDHNLLYFKDKNTSRTYQIEIVEKSFKNFYYKDQILSIFTDKGITNYKIILP
ncbi:hypothetical protein [Flavobacterium sp.]|uniref:hypothetical protein n=1 Tax=Flavobacterium sp. TaxID=239 RepID=UPI003752ACC4